MECDARGELLRAVDPNADNIWSAAANRVFRFGGGGAWYLPAAAAARRQFDHKAKFKEITFTKKTHSITITMFIFFQTNP